MEGTTLAVGVQGGNQGIGSVMIYDSNNTESFEFQSLLVPDDGMTNDDFGRAVAMSGNFVIVGAQRHDAEGENSGAAYIFERSENDEGGIEWSQVAKLTPPEPQLDERFGISVSIQGNVAIVGANGNDSNGENSGAAYLFTLRPNIIGIEEWRFTKKLVASDGAPGDNFGFSVAIYGDHAVVGAVWANNRGGSAYVFINQGGTWTTQGKFEGEKANDQFGWSVSIFEEIIAVGAIKFDDRISGPMTREVRDRGSVNIYVKDDDGSWFKEARLEPNDGNIGDHFGRSIDLHEDCIIVSAPFNAETGIDVGAAYIYQRESSVLDAWVLRAKVLPTEEDAALTEFGFSVGVSDNNFVASSKYSDVETGLLGNAYIYSTMNPGKPTASPTLSLLPTEAPPTSSPSLSIRPSVALSQTPSLSIFPTVPTETSNPTNSPTELVTTMSPATSPTDSPTISQSDVPTSMPSSSPTKSPSFRPSFRPSSRPSFRPSSAPTSAPSSVPSEKARTTSPSLASSSTPSAQSSAEEPLTSMPTYPPTIPEGVETSTKPSSTDATAAPTPFGDFTEAPIAGADDETKIPTYNPTSSTG